MFTSSIYNGRIFVLAWALALLSASVAFGGKGNGNGGGNGGGEDPPPLPNVRYSIHYIETQPPDLYIFPFQMNSSQLVVGNIPDFDHAFLYDLTTQSFHDLNDVISAADRDGWTIFTAREINDVDSLFGASVVGSALNEFGDQRAYVIDDIMSPSPQFQLLPLIEGANSYGAQSINGVGDIAVKYYDDLGERWAYIYNPWLDAEPLQLGVALGHQLVSLNEDSQAAGKLIDGRAFIFIPGQGIQTIDGDFSTVRGLNDSNQFTGSLNYVYSTNPKGKNGVASKQAIRYSGQLEVLADTPRSTGRDINSEGDVVLTAGTTNIGRLYVYHNEDGLILVDDLISEDDPNREVFTSSTSQDGIYISDRDTTTGYGQIVGRASDGTVASRAVVLTPHTVPAP